MGEYCVVHACVYACSMLEAVRLLAAICLVPPDGWVLCGACISVCVQFVGGCVTTRCYMSHASWWVSIVWCMRVCMCAVCKRLCDYSLLYVSCLLMGEYCVVHACLYVCSLLEAVWLLAAIFLVPPDGWVVWCVRVCMCAVCWRLCDYSLLYFSCLLMGEYCVVHACLYVCSLLEAVRLLAAICLVPPDGWVLCGACVPICVQYASLSTGVWHSVL